MSERATTPAGFAVFDPEDTEAAERFAAIFCKHPSPGWVTSFQEALREYVKPKPRCAAAVTIAGEHFRCVEPPDHGGAHHNPDARAIWAGADDA